MKKKAAKKKTATRGRPSKGLDEHVLFVRITTEDHDAIARIVERYAETDPDVTKSVLVRRWIRASIVEAEATT